MKVTIASGGTWRFDFRVETKRNGKHTTICEARDGTKAFIKNAYIASATVKCNPKDKYNQIMGKTKALDRLMRDIFPLSSSRNTRLLIWDKFFYTACGKMKDKEFISGYNFLPTIKRRPKIKRSPKK